MSNKITDTPDCAHCAKLQERLNEYAGRVNFWQGKFHMVKHENNKLRNALRWVHLSRRRNVEKINEDLLRKAKEIVSRGYLDGELLAIIERAEQPNKRKA